MRWRETTSSSVKSLPPPSPQSDSPFVRVSDECLCCLHLRLRSLGRRSVARRVFEFKSVSLYFPLDKRRLRVCARPRPLELNAEEGGILELGIRLLLLLLLLQRRRRRTQCRLNIPPIHSGSCSSRRKKEREREIGGRRRAKRVTKQKLFVERQKPRSG